jgi:sugar diacid utilization regulator
MDADLTYRVAAIMPGPEADPTPEEPGMDEADLEQLADRIDRLLRRSARGHAASSGIRVPLAMTWRGAIVAILAADAREWQRLQEAVRSTLGRPRSEPSWTAVAVQAEGVTRLASALAELQEGLTVAEAIGRHGVIDDLSELAIERLLLSDPDLAGVVVERELGALLADQRMGEELIETVQTYFDAGGNRREIARRMHLADRTVTYRLQRVEELLGHGLDGEPGRRLSVALTLHRLTSDSRR